MYGLTWPYIRLRRSGRERQMTQAMGFKMQVAGSQQTRAEQVAKEVETAMYTHFNGAGKEYRTKFRSLHFNLKDPSNLELRLRVLTHQITPQQLCLMVPSPPPLPYNSGKISTLDGCHRCGVLRQGPAWW
jgi:hypothetical protein